MENPTQLYKAQAKCLRQALQSDGINITHSRALELVASLHGFKDWNTLYAQHPSQLEHPMTLLSEQREPQLTLHPTPINVTAPNWLSVLPEHLGSSSAGMWVKGKVAAIEQADQTYITVVYTKMEEGTPIADAAVAFSVEGTQARVMAVHLINRTVLNPDLLVIGMNMHERMEALQSRHGETLTEFLQASLESTTQVFPFDEHLDGADLDVFEESPVRDASGPGPMSGMGAGRLKRRPFSTLLAMQRGDAFNTHRQLLWK